MKKEGSRKDLLMTDDIVKSVSKETGYSEEVVLKHINFMSHWLETLAHKEDVYTIYLPYLGKFYFNLRCAEYQINELESLEGKLGRFPLNSKQRNTLKTLKDKSLGIRKIFGVSDRYLLHGATPRIYNPYFRRRRKLKNLESWQNEYKKEDKNS